MNVRLKEPQRFRALLVDANEERHRFLQSLLDDRGFLVIATCATVGEISASAQAAADLLILYGATLDHSTVEQIRTARQTTNLPIMLISEGDAPADVAVVIEAGADSILPIGVAAANSGSGSL
jgi:DNA-binding response OmpR family regulator